MKSIAACLVLLCLAGCSSSGKSVSAATGERNEDANKQRICTDPTWKEEHLGLWFNLCKGPTPFG
jgi:hypothetical protein